MYRNIKFPLPPSIPNPPVQHIHHAPTSSAILDSRLDIHATEVPKKFNNFYVTESSCADL